MVKAKKPMGRPKLSEQGSLQLTIRFPMEIVKEVDQIIAERFGAPDRVAIFRELVMEALANRRAKKGDKPVR